MPPVYGPAMPISTLATLAALAVALTATAGCGRGGREDASRLPALRPAELTRSAPPAGATDSAGSLAAARGVVRRYYAALDGLRIRMRAAPLARLMTPDCPCRAQVDAVRSALRRDERYTDRVRVIRLVAHLDRPGLIDVVVTLDVAHAGLAGPAGRVTAPTTVHNLHRELLLRRIGNRWLVERVIAV